MLTDYIDICTMALLLLEYELKLRSSLTHKRVHVTNSQKTVKAQFSRFMQRVLKSLPCVLNAADAFPHMVSFEDEIKSPLDILGALYTQLTFLGPNQAEGWGF
ncbi:hypothetical protein [Absidia glauca]|uniref:Uncharacterized protein n=1 Tax=Absidia glauca TaxID=4829 RepID=A0A168NLV1_ABSGL|nr:hypothetical protein [Absidia glauca]